MTIPADSLGTGATYSTEKARASSRGQRPPRVVRAVYGCARIPRKDTRQVPAVAETRGATRDGRVCGRRSAASAEQRGWVDTDESARSRRRRWGRDRPGATQIPFRATTPPPGASPSRGCGVNARAVEYPTAGGSATCGLLREKECTLLLPRPERNRRSRWNLVAR